MKTEPYLSFLIFIGKHLTPYLPPLQLLWVLLAEAPSEAMQHSDRGIMSHKHKLFARVPSILSYACHTKPMTAFSGHL